MRTAWLNDQVEDVSRQMRVCFGDLMNGRSFREGHISAGSYGDVVNGSRGFFTPPVIPACFGMVVKGSGLILADSQGMGSLHQGQHETGASGVGGWTSGTIGCVKGDVSAMVVAGFNLERQSSTPSSGSRPSVRWCSEAVDVAGR